MPLTEAEYVAALCGFPHKFRVGQRVRLSRYGLECNIRPKCRRMDSGIVIKVGEFNTPTVLWDGRKTGSSYFPGFIAPDRRRRQ